MIDSTMFGDFESNFDFGIDFGIDFGNEVMSSALNVPDTSIDREIVSFLVNSKSRSTVYANTSGYKRLQTFMIEQDPNGKREFFDLPISELDQLI